MDTVHRKVECTSHTMVVGAVYSFSYQQPFSAGVLAWKVEALVEWKKKPGWC
jgi:hypothetical protein